MFRINETIQFQGKEYVLTEFLGQGGMGHVFLIENKEEGVKFALKSLQYFLPDDNNFRSLINEWEKAQTVNHNNVIKYYGFHDGLSATQIPYLVMELANTGSLEDFLKSTIKLFSEAECLEIFHQIIDGMEAVNNVLIHRDIKPDNIFINDGVIKIADFGLAKIAQDKTRSKTFKGWGTEPYMAPEAYRSEKNTIQMDMYSIGHVFYRIAALKHAFGDQNDWERAHLIVTATPLSSINTDISPKVSAVINKLIAKKPNDRYTSWDEVRQDLLRSAQNISDNKYIINNLLKKKLEEDLNKERELVATQSKENEKKRKLDIINYQFENEIMLPINNFLTEFNKVSGNESKMSINNQSSRGVLSYKILFNGKYINIWFNNIGESDIREVYADNGWGEKTRQKIIPKFQQKSVLAWGAIESSKGTGFNIVLKQSDQDEYGEFYILKNQTSGLSTRNENRPNPFAFSHNDLLKEIGLVGALHVYSTTVSDLNNDELLELISDLL